MSGHFRVHFVSPNFPPASSCLSWSNFLARRRHLCGQLADTVAVAANQAKMDRPVIVFLTKRFMIE